MIIATLTKRTERTDYLKWLDIKFGGENIVDVLELLEDRNIIEERKDCCTYKLLLQNYKYELGIWEDIKSKVIQKYNLITKYFGEHLARVTYPELDVISKFMSELRGIVNNLTEVIETEENEMINLEEENKILREENKRLNLEKFGYLDEIDSLELDIQYLKEIIHDLKDRSYNSVQSGFSRKRCRRN